MDDELKRGRSVAAPTKGRSATRSATRSADRWAARARWVLLAAGLAGGGALLTGCESTPTVAAPVEARTGAGAGAGRAGAEAATGTGTGAGAAAGAGGVLPQSRVAGVTLGGKGGTGVGAAGAPRVVYFDYDSFAIKNEYQGLIEAEAKALLARPAGRLVIEGHTDERGGSEYNLALGQKRAEAVLRVLVLLGAPAQRLEAVSFGKERPAADGHDEAAWAKNRRAELKDQ